jgi:hypothetical protein
VRFARHFLAALVLVVALAFVGVAIEHSALSQTVAPHSNTQEATQFVLRNGRPYVRTVVGTTGHEKVSYRPVPFAKGFHPNGRVTGIRQGPVGSPPDLSSWSSVVQILVLMVGIALAVAGLDQLRRLARRRRNRSHAFVPG